MKLTLGKKEKTPFTKKVAGSFPLIPEGVYNVAVSTWEHRASKDNTSKYVNVQFRILDDGPYKQRVLFHKFMTEHPKKVVVEIANKKLGIMFKGFGVETSTIEDGLEQARNKNATTLVRVGVKKSEGFPDSTEIISFTV